MEILASLAILDRRMREEKDEKGCGCSRKGDIHEWREVRRKVLVESGVASAWPKRRPPGRMRVLAEPLSPRRPPCLLSPRKEKSTQLEGKEKRTQLVPGKEKRTDDVHKEKNKEKRTKNKEKNKEKRTQLVPETSCVLNGTSRAT
jgi:hypothetical protein